MSQKNRGRSTSFTPEQISALNLLFRKLDMLPGGIQIVVQHRDVLAVRKKFLDMEKRLDGKLDEMD